MLHKAEPGDKCLASYLFNIFIKEVEDVLLFLFSPVSFDMIIPGAPTYCKRNLTLLSQAVHPREGQITLFNQAATVNSTHAALS